MFFAPLILAAGGLPTLISGAPVESVELSRRESGVEPAPLSPRAGSNTYRVYGGTGEISQGWPSIDSWQKFDDIFSANKQIMKEGCAQWGVPENTDAEIADLKESILNVSSVTGVDKRFILAVALQETNGCVRAPTSNNGVVNPGIMQSHNGPGSCNRNGVVDNPCPKEKINQMIYDGAGGTSAGDGLKQCLSQATGSGVVKFYQAARIYNSGSLPSSRNLGQGGATACYVSDIANRLTSWFTGPSSCEPGAIGSLTAAEGGGSGGGGSGGGSDGGSSSSSSENPSTPTTTSSSTTIPISVPTETPTSQETHTPPSVSVHSPSATPTPTSSTSPETSGTDAPIYPHAASSCHKYYTVQANDFCEKVSGVSFPKLRQLNPGLDERCSNLWLGYRYCISG